MFACVILNTDKLGKNIAVLVLNKEIALLPDFSVLTFALKRILPNV